MSNSAKTIATPAGRTNLVRSKINILVATISWKNTKSFLQTTYFSWNVYHEIWLDWVRSELIKCQKFHYCPWLYQLPLYLNICMSFKWMKWHVMCIASARPALHGQSIIRKTYVNSYILSQKSSWRKCRHIFWVVWKSFNSLKEAISLNIQWVSCLR